MRYIVPGVPAGAQLSAFCPNMTRMAGSGAQSYKQQVSGQPGTRAIPAPVTDTAPGGPALVTLALAGTARSSDAPSFIYPSKYFERELLPSAARQAAIYSDNLMPVPATDPRGIPARLSRPPARYAGQQAIRQPRALPEWGPVPL